jgi:predicted dehydrogenase
MIDSKKLGKIKWGVAGCGRFAENAFIPVVSSLRKSKVVSLFSNSSERAKSLAGKYGIPFYYNDFKEFLNSGINAVYISSANLHHYEQTLLSAAAGKHILCEKPMAVSSVQAEEMVKACEENNVLLAVSYVHRFHPLIIKAKELIDSGFIGKLVSLNLIFNIDYPPGINFRFVKELSGGGALRDIGTHLIDLLRYFGGEVDEVKGVMDNVIYKSEVDDFAAAIVKFEKTGYGYFNVSFNNKKAFNRIEILGHTGALSIENLIGVKNKPAKLTILSESDRKISFRKGGNKVLYMMKSIQRSFLKNETPLVTGYDGLINMKIMEELESQCLLHKS